MYVTVVSVQIIVRAAASSYKLQIKQAVSPSHSILTPDQPVLALTLYRRTPVSIASVLVVFFVLFLFFVFLFCVFLCVTGMIQPEKSPTGKAGIVPRYAALPLGQRGRLTQR